MIFIKFIILIVDMAIAILSPVKRLSFIHAHFRRGELAAEGDPKTLFRIYTILTIIGIQGVIFLVTYLFHFDNSTKTLFFDYYHLNGLSAEFNLATAPVLAMIAYFYWVGHLEVKGNEATQLAYKVLFRRDEEVDIFLESHTPKGKNVYNIIKKSAFFFLNIQQVFIVVYGKCIYQLFFLLFFYIFRYLYHKLSTAA